MKNSFRRKISGFTLIELLVVVLIIGILSATALPQYQKAVRKSRLAQIQSLCRALAEAEMRHYMDTGEFTSDFRNLDVMLPGDAVLNEEGSFANLQDNFSISIWINAAGTVGTIGGKIEGLLYLQDFSVEGGTSFRQCRAKETDSLNISICKGMGGTEFGGENGTIWFRLP